MEPLLEEWGPLLVEQLREQLNNLTAAAQLLTPVVQESGEERHRQYLAILNQSVYRMTRTLNNAEYAQLPEGEPALRRAPLDLAGLCRELERQVTPLAALAGVQFSYEEERACLLTVGDAALLRRMLLNLIANALGAAGISLVLTLIFGPVAFKAVGSMFWFFTYRFTLAPILAVAPVFALLGALVPLAVYRSISKHTVVERLRESDN